MGQVQVPPVHAEGSACEEKTQVWQTARHWNQEAADGISVRLCFVFMRCDVGYNFQCVSILLQPAARCRVYPPEYGKAVAEAHELCKVVTTPACGPDPRTDMQIFDELVDQGGDLWHDASLAEAPSIG